MRIQSQSLLERVARQISRAPTSEPDAASLLRRVASAYSAQPVIDEGDGAFYAPKLDFIVKDAIGALIEEARRGNEKARAEVVDLMKRTGKGEQAAHDPEGVWWTKVRPSSASRQWVPVALT